MHSASIKFKLSLDRIEVINGILYYVRVMKLDEKGGK